MKYGLIGEHLGHSYSKIIHESLGYSYELNEIATEDIPKFFEDRNFNGINVTIPYKKTVMNYCDEISDLAGLIGAVNTIYFRKEKMIGTNTDFAGFVYMCQRSGIDFTDKTVLILGTGGAGAMVKFAACVMGAGKVYVATRNKNINIDTCDKSHKPENVKNKLGNITLVNYNELPKDAEILINTTPVGTFPDIYDTPIDLSDFDNLYAVVDLIYNPLKTALLMESEKRNIINTGGLSMLVAQAVMASHLFLSVCDEAINIADSVNNGNTLLSRYYKMNTETETVISDLLTHLTQDIKNIVLIGMPGCGKTSVGKEISRISSREFVDTDELITEAFGMDPATIINNKGEEYFRILENRVIKETAKKHSLVIATGGGSILKKENVSALSQNSDIYFIDRNPELLTSEGRPLSLGDGKIKALYEKRLPIYQISADYIVSGNDNIFEIANKILTVHAG